MIRLIIMIGLGAFVYFVLHHKYGPYEDCYHIQERKGISIFGVCPGKKYSELCETRPYLSEYRKRKEII